MSTKLDEKAQMRKDFEQLQREYKNMEAMRKVRRGVGWHVGGAVCCNARRVPCGHGCQPCQSRPRPSRRVPRALHAGDLGCRAVSRVVLRVWQCGSACEFFTRVPCHACSELRVLRATTCVWSARTPTGVL